MASLVTGLAVAGVGYVVAGYVVTVASLAWYVGSLLVRARRARARARAAAVAAGRTP
jgi:hypothetical protein